jgi:very-short-patch-repair endonuclease
MYARSLVSHEKAKLLEERARFMRFSPTRSEGWLWRRLSGSKTGFAFRRQLVIGNFIVDFACTKARLVVEVDGSSHAERGRHDARKDRSLQELGWSVLRVSNRQVIQQLDLVVLRIAEAARHALVARSKA